LIVLGLTGGIASGKSTVSAMLAELGATVIDADRLGHETYLPGTDTFAAIIDAFGPGVVGSDGFIDRQALGRIVFRDPEAMKRLTDIVWPAIHELAQRRIAELRAAGASKVVVFEAAVLLEAGWRDLVDEVWVVVADPAVAIRRLMTRSQLSREDAEARLRAQMANSERIRHADVIIENNGQLRDLRKQVADCWRTLQERLEVQRCLRGERSG
jgi:dephospho-CoA kinase